ncbi:hypothetical protein SDC9_201975 [bioreactor metagenome]|uniref:Uncharacterized protein n=1 Tax=bioreactor metagenome TaxID=1076179 RepID=A0A645ISD4_9ZZZZ
MLPLKTAGVSQDIFRSAGSRGGGGVGSAVAETAGTEVVSGAAEVAVAVAAPDPAVEAVLPSGLPEAAVDVADAADPEGAWMP